MGLVFMLAGWSFDRDGKKATTFSTLCNALGVQFDLSSSGGEKFLLIRNTDQRIHDLQTMIAVTLQSSTLSKQDALVLRAKLGVFAWRVGFAGAKVAVLSCLRTFQ